MLSLRSRNGSGGNLWELAWVLRDEIVIVVTSTSHTSAILRKTEETILPLVTHKV